MAQTPHEHWAAGDAYEQFMGRWSREVAARFLTWLSPRRLQSWLDVGCGTAALTRTILAAANPQMVVGLDPSIGFVQYASQQTPAASFLGAVGDALPHKDETFDAVVSGLALNFMPQLRPAIAEMRRTVKAGGTVAAYVWDYAGQMEFLRYFWDAALALDAQTITVHEGYRFPICQPDPLRQLWQQAGLRHVFVEALDIPTSFDNFASYWQPFTLGNFPAPRYLLSLDEAQRKRLHDHVQAAIPTADDGSIHLIARVWAVRGTR